MAKLTLVIGNKAYSSWSLRPWLALRHTGRPFEEIVVPLRQPETAAQIRRHSPTGKVPVLLADGQAIWESLAICEYLAETCPDAGLWPADPKARAHARAISAEMHAGFVALRRHMPMDLKRRVPHRERPAEVDADIARVCALWQDTLARFGGGPFLFGSFTIADAMFAPVCTRFDTYGVALDPQLADYAAAVLTTEAMREWRAAAAAEPWVIDYV